MRKLNNFLNILTGAFVGAFIGHGIYVCWDFKMHPNLYAIRSVPWYTSILVHGIFTLAVVLVVIAAKVFIKKYKEKH